MTNIDKVMRVFGGGTSTDLCLLHLLGKVGKQKASGFFYGNHGYNSDFPASEKNDSPVKVDNIVIFTDEQQNSGSPVVEKFREYRRTVNKNAKLFIVDIAPYSGRLANQDEPGVTFIYGWNETVLDVLRFAMEGCGSHVEQIKLMK
jgi:60 kDa SS-A/Ro ribonucleoprotein